MSLVATRELLDAAVASGGAVAGFNVITLEHAEAIAEGAGRAGTGAILQLSDNAIRFHGGDPRPILAGCRAVAEAASVPLALHLDHIESPELVALAIDNADAWGLGSIMVDASKLDYASNVAATADAAHRAHVAGLWVEAELGAIGGKGGAHAPGVRTDPDEAAAFVAGTGVDALALSAAAVLAPYAGAFDADHHLEQAERVGVERVGMRA
jgi:fructose-bisphosphate aldolase class II